MTHEPDHPRPTRLFGFHLTQGQSDMLDELTKRSGRSRSAEVRKLIERGYAGTITKSPEAGSERNLRGRA